MAPIRSAILGYGRSGSRMHADALEASEAFEVVAVCDIDENRQKQASERFGCAIYDDYRQMLKKEQLDLVIVVTRSDQHCEMTCDCVAAGTDVLVTKPWCVDEAEARRMIKAAADAGQTIYPWLPSRWGAVYRRVQEIIAAGTIGEMFQIHRFEGKFSLRNDWQMAKRYGGGYLLNWGPHIIDPPVLLAGGRVRDVWGRLIRIGEFGDAETVFSAMITMTNGIVVHVEHAFSAAPLTNWCVQGDRGTISAVTNKVTVHAGTPKMPGDPTQYEGMKPGQLAETHEEVEGQAFGDTDEVYAELADAIQGRRAFGCCADDALELTRLLDAVRESDRTGQVVTF